MLAAAAMGVVSMAGTASADIGTITLDGSGSAHWFENGDTLRICDLRADGWGVREYIYRPKSGDPENGTVLIKGNDGKHDNNCQMVSENVPENIRLSLKVCNYAADRIVNCAYTSIPDRP